MIKQNLLYVFLVFLLFACKNDVTNNDKILARVGTEKLYFSDIKHQLPTELKNEDSIAFVESFVQKWVMDKLLYERAQLNLPDDYEDIEEKVEAFKQSLLVYKYEQKLIGQKLNKKITDDEIQTFYNEHKTEFLLNETIVKLYFAVFPKSLGEPSKITKYLNSSKDEDIEKFKDYCYQYSLKFIFPDKWTNSLQFMGEIPQANISLPLLSSHQLVVEQDSLKYYVFKIEQILNAGDLAPLEYVINDIKQVILQKRTQDLNKSLRNKIYDEAIKKNDVEFYLK